MPSALSLAAEATFCRRRDVDRRLRRRERSHGGRSCRCIGYGLRVGDDGRARARHFGHGCRSQRLDFVDMLVFGLKSIDHGLLDSNHRAENRLGDNRLRKHPGQIFLQFELDLLPRHVHHHALDVNLEDGVLKLLVGEKEVAVGGLDAALGGALAGYEYRLYADAAGADGVLKRVFDRRRLLAGAHQQLADVGRQIWGDSTDFVVGPKLADTRAKVEALEG